MLRAFGEPARQLISRFFSSVGDRVGSIENAHLRGDLRAVGQLAHTLRGAAASYGATALAELAAKIEGSIAAPSSAALAALIATLPPIAQASIAESSQLLQRECGQ